jgi:hypothetical protein
MAEQSEAPRNSIIENGEGKKEIRVWMDGW